MANHVSELLTFLASKPERIRQQYLLAATQLSRVGFTAKQILSILEAKDNG